MLRFNILTYVQCDLIYLALALGSSSDTFVLEVLFLISEIRTRPIIKGLRGSKSRLTINNVLHLWKVRWRDRYLHSSRPVK